MKRSRCPTSRCNTSSLSLIRKFMFVAARSAKAPRVGDVHLEDLRHLVRNAVDQVGQRLGGAHDAGDEVVQLVRVDEEFLGRACAGDHERLFLLHRFDRDSAESLQRDLHRVATGLIRSCTRAAATRPNELPVVDRVVDIARRHDEGDSPAPDPRWPAATPGSPAPPSGPRSSRVDRRWWSATPSTGGSAGVLTEDFVATLGTGHEVRREETGRRGDGRGVWRSLPSACHRPIFNGRCM